MADEVEKVLKEFEVIPDVIPTAPSQFLSVTYNDGLIVNKGAELTPTQVEFVPTVSWEAEPDSFYTLIMTDPDAPSRKEPKMRECCHWLLVNIPGADWFSGDEILWYIGAGPPKDGGLHRYIFVLYKQPGELEFDEKRADSSTIDGRLDFHTAKFAEKYNLGTPVALNFFQAQFDEYSLKLHKKLGLDIKN